MTSLQLTSSFLPRRKLVFFFWVSAVFVGSSKFYELFRYPGRGAMWTGFDPHDFVRSRLGVSIITDNGADQWSRSIATEPTSVGFFIVLDRTPEILSRGERNFRGIFTKKNFLKMCGTHTDFIPFSPIMYICIFNNFSCKELLFLMTKNLLNRIWTRLNE